MSLVLGALLACGMALLQHSLDDHVNDEEEARSLLDIPVLGVLPLVVSDAIKEGEKTPFDLESGDRPALILSRSEPRLMESFRMLRSNVYFALVNSPSRTILVTSTVPGEGKTTTAANLATIMALDGRRVILVDADMRRPSLDKFFNLTRQPGLSNILAGQISWRDALQDTKVPGLRLITSGALPPNPAELLGSPALDELIPELQQEADMVVFDTPPCPATADTPVLSSKVDGVIYVMHLGKVRKAGLQHAFDLLHQANAHLLGVVFNKFESSAQQGYGYYYGYEQQDGADGGDSAVGKKNSRKAKTSSSNGATPLNGDLDGDYNGAGSTPGTEASVNEATGAEK
jgi:receptor protein-tyrosine kinase